MTTTISLPVAEYNRAKTFAEEQNLSIDELFVALIGQLTLKEEDAVWNQHDFKQPPYTIEELSARIDESPQIYLFFTSVAFSFCASFCLSAS